MCRTTNDVSLRTFLLNRKTVMQPQANLTRPSRTAAVFTYSLLASLAFMAAAQAGTSHAGTPRITASYSESCGVTSTGEGRCWGPNANGEGTLPTGKTWASISTGTQHSCGVTTTGEGLCWGVNGDGQANVPTGKTWASITPGGAHSCGVTTTGEGLCWGDNTFDQGTVPTGKIWEAINAGATTTCGVTSTGEGLCWGNNSFWNEAVVPSGKTWASITAPENAHTCGVTTSGEGLCWGYNGSGQNNVPEGKTWASITVGTYYACGVTTTGEGLCWGRNEELQEQLVGNTLPPTGKTWASIDAGHFHTCGVTTDGDGLCWGYDGHTLAHTDTWSYEWVDATPADGRLVVPAGNYGEPVVSTDTTAPDAPVVSGAPSGSTAATTARLRFSGEANATFTCSVDGASYAACTSPLALTGLNLGSHTVRVKQTDEAGNISTEATANWTIVAVNAPRLLAKVGLKVNTKTKVTTLTLKASADTTGGRNSVKWIEYFSHEPRPAANAAPHPNKIRQYATTVVLRAGEVAFWVRVKDTNGKWSGWYSTKH